MQDRLSHNPILTRKRLPVFSEPPIPHPATHWLEDKKVKNGQFQENLIAFSGQQFDLQLNSKSEARNSKQYQNSNVQMFEAFLILYFCHLNLSLDKLGMVSLSNPFRISDFDI